MNAVTIMRRLGFDHKDVLASAVAAYIHDIGYLESHEPLILKNDPTGYNGGPRASYNMHPKLGAEKVKQMIEGISGFIEDEKFYNAHPELQKEINRLKKMMSFKDESGAMDLLQKDSRITKLIYDVIYYHNDYAQSEEGYDPSDVDIAALVVQLCDKLDHCNKRVYKEHVSDHSVFNPDDENFDDKFFHRSVPFCIKKYKLQIDPGNQKVNAIYYVDLSKFENIVREFAPEYCFTEEEFIRHFCMAYSKNCRIASEAAGWIFAKMNGEKSVKNEKPLKVIWRFKNGGARSLDFSPPERGEVK